MSILDDVPFDIRLDVERMIAAGECTRAEAEHALEVMIELADRDLAGEIPHEMALARCVELGFEVRRRRGS